MSICDQAPAFLRHLTHHRQAAAALARADASRAKNLHRAIYGNATGQVWTAV
jgi:hypothetical protein